MADMRSTRRPPLLVPILLCAFAVFLARPSVADGEPGGWSGGDAGISARVARLTVDAALVARQYEAGLREAAESRAGTAGPGHGSVGGAGTRARRQPLEERNAALAGAVRTVRARLEEARSALERRAEASVAAGSCRGAVRLDQPRTRQRAAWVTPVETYRLSAGFGSDGERWAHRHTGQDFAVPVGTPVRAVGAGRVVRVSCGGAFGIAVVIEHPEGRCTQYAHLAAVTVERGRRVRAGQWIGQSGSTGNSTGPHLHFEARAGRAPGSAVDPVSWLAARGVTLR